MELSDIRAKIDTVDDQLLKLFLERMDLAEEIAAYKNEHHLPILNKERERAVLARVTENAGARERYAYHLFSTLFELARSRQAELINAPTKVGARVRACLENRDQLFPQTGLVACQGIEGGNSGRPGCAGSACCPLRTAPTAPSGRCTSSCGSTA